jgi:hypothetical protein
MVKESNGRARVMAPDAEILFKACEEWGCEEDEAIVALRERLGPEPKQKEAQKQAVEAEPERENTQKTLHLPIWEKRPTVPTTPTQSGAADSRHST